MLNKYISDPSHKIDYKDLEIKDDMLYIEMPMKILDQNEIVLTTKTISIVKVLWRNNGLEEATWELVSEMRGKYLELFE